MKAPWFKLWAAEMLREMRWLTPEQRGYLFALMCEAWLSEPRGSLPINRGMIWKMAGADSQEKFEAESGPVLAMFEQSGESYLFRKLVDQDRDIKQVSQSRSDAGKNGAKRRWQGDSKPITNAINGNGNVSNNGNGKPITNVVPNDGKRIADLDVRSRLRQDSEETEDAEDESAREEEALAPIGASATRVAPLTYEYEEGDEDIPF